MEGLSLIEKTPLMNTPLRSSTSSLPTTPIQLSGHFNGDTVQVEGDTGDFQFSMQFNVHKRKHVGSDLNSGDKITHFPPHNIPDVEHNENEHTEPLILESHVDNVECFEDSDSTRRVGVVTRLRSGSISAIKYSESEVKVRKWTRSEKGLLERVLRRHSLPVRPCSSYAFFVMATWSSVKCSSFAETTKSLARIWCKLPQRDRKAFETMASKDRARYRRQCLLLKNATRKIKASRKKLN